MLGSHYISLFIIDIDECLPILNDSVCKGITVKRLDSDYCVHRILLHRRKSERINKKRLRINVTPFFKQYSGRSSHESNKVLTNQVLTNETVYLGQLITIDVSHMNTH